jgi:uncharacterized membrane protein
MRINRPIGKNIKGLNMVKTYLNNYQLLKTFNFVMPMLIGFFLFSFHLTGDLFGDEFVSYRRVVLLVDFSNLIDKPRILMHVNDILSRFGYLTVGAPWGIRLYSLFFALGTVIIVGQLAKMLLGKKYQITAMWLAAFSPILIEFGGEGRPYAMLAFLGTAFLVCLLKLVEKESYKNALVLVIISFLGCLSRIQFLAYLIFGACYYLAKRKRITKYALVACLISVPILYYSITEFIRFGSFTPKVPEGAPGVSTLNFLLRTGLAFNFGYSTFSLPELGAARNVPILSVLIENLPAVFLILIATVGIVIGAIRFTNRDPRTFLFLLTFIILPSVGITLAGQLGYAIIREKYLIGVLGAYLVLLSAIFKELIQKKLGWVPVLCFAAVIGISLYHYFVLPEIYSRREMHSALNQQILNQAKISDTIVTYPISEKYIKTGTLYYTFLNKGYRYIDIDDELTEGITLEQLAKKINERSDQKIFLISRETVRNLVDPKNILLQTFKRQREWQRKRFGRNLSLYILSKPIK